MASVREPPNEQAVLNIYEAMRSELSQIYSNITDLEMQVSEHSLVINAIQPLDQSRKCFRMIGGVLVERTVREVLPAVQRNKEGLEEVVRKLYETLEKKKKDMTEFEAKYQIRLRKQDDPNKEEGDKKKEGNAQGVLVGAAAAAAASSSQWKFLPLLFVSSFNGVLLRFSGEQCFGMLQNSVDWRSAIYRSVFAYIDFEL